MITVAQPRVKVQDHPDLRRDTRSGGIINVDKEGYASFIRQRDERRAQNERMEQNEKRLYKIESLLEQLFEMVKNGHS